MKIQIKNRYTGDVIFEHDEDENSMLKTVIEAIKQGVDLSYADLCSADLSYADLCSAKLSYADLCYAKLRSADLSYADLRYAELRSAKLSYAELRSAKLSSAKLSYADLRYAELSSAKLSYANLSYAKLSYANLSYADLRYAELSYADLRSADNIPFVPLACPSDGAFTAWKKVKNCLVELYIPEKARRSSATTNKCRCDKAKVISITDLETNESVDKVSNNAYAMTVYEAGCWVTPDSFDENRWNECSHGIHFFTNKQEAINY